MSKKTDSIYRVGEKVPLTGLSKLLGITVHSIKKMMKDGLPHRLESGRVFFDTVAATKWIIQQEVGKVMVDGEGGEKLTIEEARRRREVAGMYKAELDLAKEREQVANIDDLMNEFTSALSQIRAKLISQASRMSGILSHQDESEISKMLSNDAKEILEVLSGYNHEYTGNKCERCEKDRKSDQRSVPQIPTPPT